MIDQSVEDLMTASVQTVAVETTASAVARLFAENGIGSAVVDETETLRGIVTESDVMQQVAVGADVTTIPVGSFMTAPVVTAERTNLIDAATTLMESHSIRRLPVVDGDELVGILTTTNLVHHIPRLREAVVRARTRQTDS